MADSGAAVICSSARTWLTRATKRSTSSRSYPRSAVENWTSRSSAISASGTRLRVGTRAGPSSGGGVASMAETLARPTPSGRTGVCDEPPEVVAQHRRRPDARRTRAAGVEAHARGEVREVLIAALEHQSRADRQLAAKHRPDEAPQRRRDDARGRRAQLGRAQVDELAHAACTLAGNQVERLAIAAIAIGQRDDRLRAVLDR